MEDHEDQRELQLLPSPNSLPSSSRMSSRPSTDSSSLRYHRSTLPDHHHHSNNSFDVPASLDLQLSISLRPIQPPSDCVLAGPISSYAASLYDDVMPETAGCVEALKWQAAEQIRLAAIEKAYAERVREMTRREMELAQSEFARARHMWERAREEVEKAERMKERATRQIADSNTTTATCMEITCQSCRERFRP